MILSLNIKNTENIEGLTDYDKRQIEEIVTALVSTGSLTGVKGGSVNIHFDAVGVFQGVEHNYWTWRRRKL